MQVLIFSLVLVVQVLVILRDIPRPIQSLQSPLQIWFLGPFFIQDLFAQASNMLDGTIFFLSLFFVGLNIIAFERAQSGVEVIDAGRLAIWERNHVIIYCRLIKMN